MSDLVGIARVAAAMSARCAHVSLTRQIALSPDAVLLAVVAMSGEPATVHAFAVGPLGIPTARGITDPKDRDDQYLLLADLAATLDGPWQRAREAGTHPQVLVTGPAVADHLLQLAQRLAAARGLPAQLRTLGRRLAYLHDRHDVPGQQSLVVCTDALTRHAVTGMSPDEEHHLAAVLEWWTPGAGLADPGEDVHARVAAAELVPAGPATRPEHDRAHVVPALALVAEPPVLQGPGPHQAPGASGGCVEVPLLRGAAGPPGTATDLVSALVSEMVQLPLSQQWQLLTNAHHELARLRDPEGSPLPDLPDLARRKEPVSALQRLTLAEAKAFSYWVERVEEPGARFYVGDSDKSAAFRIARNEAALENLRLARVLGDPMAREQGVLDGAVARVTVTDVGTRAAGTDRPGRRGWIEGTLQPPTGLRPGERWRQAAAGTAIWLVEQVLDDDSSTARTADMPGHARPQDLGTPGSPPAPTQPPSPPEAGPQVRLVRTAPGPVTLQPGEVLDLVADLPDWDASRRASHRLGERTRTPGPWSSAAAATARRDRTTSTPDGRNP